MKWIRGFYTAVNLEIILVTFNEIQKHKLMQEKVQRKIDEASSISKKQIEEKVKGEFSERYDQMIIDSEIIRNDVYYINYSAKYINMAPKKLVFAMVPDVKYVFESNCIGVGGAVSELDQSILKEIKSSGAVVADKGFGVQDEAGNFKKSKSVHFLAKGFMDSKEAVAGEQAERAAAGEEVKEEKKGLMGSLKSAGSSISKAMDQPIGGGASFDDDDDDDGDDFFESFNWLETGGRSENDDYTYLKSNCFEHIEFKYDGDYPSKSQPLHFIPALTSVNDCKACKGKGEVTCPTCKGKGSIKCRGYVGSGSGPMGNQRYSCSGGKVKCESCDGKGCPVCNHKGKRYCPTCGGNGEVPCERKYGSSYGVGKLADAASGKPYCGGSGVIKCKPCKATGEIGTLVYVKVEVDETKGEFYKYANQEIEQIKKQPNLLYPYLRKGDVKRETVFTDINGRQNEYYDTFSRGFASAIETEGSLHKGNEYPRLMQEELYYDVIPLATLDYNHILTGTIHQVSGVAKGNQFDILFHSDPTAVKKFHIMNLFKVYGWLMLKAFATKRYKVKMDKKHEIFMLVRVAKADGQIEDSEKRVLMEIITHLDDFSAGEKAELFNLFSMKELPAITEEETVISTKERAADVVVNLNKMMKEDGEVEAPEVKMIADLKSKIDSNIGKHPGFWKSFFKTWQVSIPMILLIVGLTTYTVYKMYFAPPPVKTEQELFEEEMASENAAQDANYEAEQKVAKAAAEKQAAEAKKAAEEEAKKQQQSLEGSEYQGVEDAPTEETSEDE
ncbi:MAG: hypothetical protein RL138_1263 [Bacteroidota bacterium]|jgi:hypothetical protein